MKRMLSALLAAAALLLAGSAGAVTITGAGIINDASGTNLLSFDADVTSASPIFGSVLLGPADTGPITLNSVIFKGASAAFNAFELTLTGGATFSFVGDVTDGLGNFFPNIVAGATSAIVYFAPNQAFTLGGIEIGDPLGLTGAYDWTIDVSGVLGGFGLELRPYLVPEPGVLALLGVALALLVRKRSLA